MVVAATITTAGLRVTTAGLESPSKRSLPKLPENTFALFVMDNPDPLIIENSEAVYLGRFAQVPTASSVDLTQYEAAELGVSRSHARITYLEGIYELEDLASSNGTWLNYQRLAYGKSYELHNGDIILLGQLQLVIYLPESTRKWEVNFDARRTKTVDTVYLQIFTPYFMETVLSKFLQAIVDLQQVCLLCRGQNTEDVHIVSIKAAHQSPILHISLDNANEAVHYIRKWLNPLRQVYAGRTIPQKEVESPCFPRRIVEDYGQPLAGRQPRTGRRGPEGIRQGIKTCCDNSDCLRVGDPAVIIESGYMRYKREPLLTWARESRVF